MAAHRDPWAQLDVSRSADDATIKSAFRKLARQYHPDRNDGDREKEALFQDVARAYEDIRDEPSRSRWLTQHEGPRARDDGFYDTFGSPAFPTAGLRRDAPRDIQRKLTISFREAFEGLNKEMTFSVDELCSSCGGSGAAPGYKPRACPVCRGTGEVAVGRVASPCANCGARGYIVEHPCPHCQNGMVRRESPFVVAIPAGVRDGQSIHLPLPSQGQVGRSDIIVTVKITPSAVFRRTLKDPADLLIVVPITYSEACFGASVKVPTPDRTIQLRIPAGTQTGKAFRISGKGMPKAGREGARGDLYARVQMVVPAKLSAAQHRLVQQLAHYDPDDLRAELFAALRD